MSTIDAGEGGLLPPDFRERPAFLLAGVREHHAFADAASTIPAQWQRFRRLTIPNTVDAGVRYGAGCGTDLAAGRFEYMCGVQVADFAGIGPELGRMRVPAQRYAVFTHRGGVGALHQAWTVIWEEWLPSSGCVPADTPDVELYDDRFTPRTGEGVIEIWFPIE